jgi:hypothetical protein
MNVFITDHPMVQQHRRDLSWIWRLVWKSAVVYVLYLILFGPIYALMGRGWLDFLPELIRNSYFLPAAPIYFVLGMHNPYDDYLPWWYDDPNAPETTW